jgi:hypothetical protein
MIKTRATLQAATNAISGMTVRLMDLAVMVFARRPDRQLKHIIQPFPVRWLYLSQDLIRSRASQIPGLHNSGTVSSSSAPEKVRIQFLSLRHMTLILLFKPPAKPGSSKRPKTGG